MGKSRSSLSLVIVPLFVCIGVSLILIGGGLLFNGDNTQERATSAGAGQRQGASGEPTVQHRASPIPTAPPEPIGTTQTASPQATVITSPPPAMPHSQEMQEIYRYINNPQGVVSIYALAKLPRFLSYTDKTTPTRQLVLPFNVAPSELIVLSVLSQKPVTFTLTLPSGQLLTPDIAASDPAITFTAQLQKDEGFYTQYVIRHPPVGHWSAQVERDPSNPMVLLGNDWSSLTLEVGTDLQYRAGEQVTMYAMLGVEQGQSTVQGATITGTVTYGHRITHSFSFGGLEHLPDRRDRE